MREWIDMRVGDLLFMRQLPAGVGVSLYSEADREMHRELEGDAYREDDEPRRLYYPKDSPVWDQVREAICALRGTDHEPVYNAWYVRRYTQRELISAELLRLLIPRDFEPAGEECGTVYDESASCPRCGAGRIQKSDLHVRLRRVFQESPSIPQAKRTGIARTIADEIIVSRTAADLMRQARITGVKLLPVRGCGSDADITPLWQQFAVVGSAGRMMSPTVFGVDPFDLDEEGEFRCPMGHVSGLNLLSEVYIDRNEWDGSDAAATADLVGRRVGLLVPTPVTLISQRFYQLLKENNVKGFKAEVAHLV
jgi:hypothetical protein